MIVLINLKHYFRNWFFKFKVYFDWIILIKSYFKIIFGDKDVDLLYQNGKGVKQDYTKANEYFQKAADDGYNDAFYYLASSYDRGQGFQQDYTKAIELYHKAGELGF